MLLLRRSFIAGTFLSLGGFISTAQTNINNGPFEAYDIAAHATYSKIYVVGKHNKLGEGVFSYQYNTKQWQHYPGMKGKKVEALSSGGPMVLDDYGKVHIFNQNKWSSLGGEGVDIASNHGQAKYYLLNKADRLVYEYGTNGQWNLIALTNARQANSIAVSKTGELYMIDNSNLIRKQVGNQWQTVGGKYARAISVADHGDVAIVSTEKNGTNYRMYTYRNNAWMATTGSGSNFVIADANNSFMLDGGKAIYKYMNGQWIKISANYDPNAGANSGSGTAGTGTGDGSKGGGTGVNAQDANGDTELHRAARAGNTSDIVRLLDEGANIEMKNNRGETPLFDGVKSRKSYVLSLLLDKGAQVNVVNGGGQSPLTLAVANNDLASVQLLLDRGANANTGNPLATAIEKNNLAMVDMLLNRSANASLGLEAAAAQNNTDIFRKLIERGARAQNNRPYELAMQRNNNEIAMLALQNGTEPKSALQLAIQRNMPDVAMECVRMGADANAAANYAIDKNHEDLLRNILQHNNQASTNALSTAIRHKKNNMVQIALQNGADPSPALAPACTSGDAQLVEMLLTSGANADAGMDSAIRFNHTPVVKLLLDYGANAKEKKYMEEAAKHGNQDVMSMLIDKGADANWGMAESIKKGNTSVVEMLLIKGANGADPKHMEVAAAGGHTNIVGLLLGSGGSADAGMIPALKANKSATVKLLVEHGVNASNPEYLNLAAHNGDYANTELLLQKGAQADAGMNAAIGQGKVNILDLLVKYGADQTKPEYVLTAVNNSQGPILDRLIKAGAPTNYVSPAGETLLHISSKTGSTSTTQILLAAGLDARAKANNGDTPLHLAVRDKNNIELAEMLLNAGANVNAINNAGDTPLEEAKGTKLKKFLKKNGGKKNKDK